MFVCVRDKLENNGKYFFFLSITPPPIDDVITGVELIGEINENLFKLKINLTKLYFELVTSLLRIQYGDVIGGGAIAT